MTHDFEGWDQAADIRRHLGYATVAIRRADRQARFSGLMALGPVIIPLIVPYRILRSWELCLRSARHYGVAWYEIPLAGVIAVGLHLAEIPGMLSAFRGEPIEDTEFR